VIHVMGRQFNEFKAAHHNRKQHSALLISKYLW